MQVIEQGDRYPVALVRAVVYTDGEGKTQEVHINILEEDGTSQTLVSKIFEMITVDTTIVRNSTVWTINE